MCARVVCVMSPIDDTATRNGNFVKAATVPGRRLQPRTKLQRPISFLRHRIKYTGYRWTRETQVKVNRLSLTTVFFKHLQFPSFETDNVNAQVHTCVALVGSRTNRSPSMTAAGFVIDQVRDKTYTAISEVKLFQCYTVCGCQMAEAADCVQLNSDKPNACFTVTTRLMLRGWGYRKSSHAFDNILLYILHRLRPTTTRII